MVQNIYDLDSFAAVLIQNNIQVKLLTDPVQALQKYVPGKYYLIIAETRLSAMTGFELYSIIKSKECIPVCFVTKLFTYYNTLKEFIKLNEQCFISPFIDPQDFLIIVQKKIRNFNLD